MAKIPTPEDLRNFWNSYSDDYEKTNQIATSQIFRLMVPFARLENSTSIVEVACGNGNGIQILREIVPASVKIYANDISERMVSRAQNKNLENVEIIIGDNENLPYPDACCNKYISNLSLHITPDPRKMLQEAYRLLQPGGIAVFSIWGKPSDHNLFSILKRAQNSIGIFPQNRSPHHLSNQTDLNQLIKDAGFSEVKSFYSCIGMDIASKDDMLFHTENMPGVIDLKAQAPEKYEELLQLIAAEALNVINSGQAIVFEVLIAVGKKN